MTSAQHTELSESIGLSELHWAVINEDYDTLENALKSKDKGINAQTTDWLFTVHEQEDSRIFIAGDFFYPPDKIEYFPLRLNLDKKTRPIHIAAAKGDVKALELFAQYKSNPNVKDGVGATPLHLACFHGHLEAAKLLLNEKTDVNAGTKTKKSLVFYDADTTPLHAALTSGHAELCRWLIEQGADIHQETKYGCSAYFFAARSGNAEVIQILADHGLKIPEMGSYRNFPLVEAVETGNYEAVELLLKLGSPIREPQGSEAPLNKAVQQNNLKIRELLISYGAKPIDYKGNISRAARSNDTTYIREYHQAGHDINKVFDNATALMTAAATGNKDTVELLLALGADVNVNPGGTALHWAMANDHYEIASLLLDHKADCSLVDQHGNSVLFGAMHKNIPDRFNMIRKMISQGANPQNKSRHGVSAYAFAEEMGDQELLKLFDNMEAGEAIDLSFQAPQKSKVLDNLPAEYDWKSTYNALWDELVPPSGEAHSVQGELMRSIGKLGDEFFRNGNINWDHNKAFYMEMIDYLKKYLLDGSIPMEEKEISESLRKMSHFNVVNYPKNDQPHHKISQAVVQWCVAHKELILK